MLNLVFGIPKLGDLGSGHPFPKTKMTALAIDSGISFKNKKEQCRRCLGYHLAYLLIKK